MQKLKAVEEAKALFSEAREWGMWRWLTEKTRARHTADAAWEALETCEQEVRGGWPAELRKAYRHPGELDGEMRTLIERLKEADKEAAKARDDAEAQFDEADRRMSTEMACIGSQMAIEAWEMREKVIRKAETLAKKWNCA